MTKRTDNTILLGYAVGSAEPVHVPLGHLVVFGQTQQAGKTTALEALIARAATRAVAFVTKRGEGGFHGGRVIPPYLVEKTDWQSVQAILESTLQAKQDFKQAWIIRACEGATTLAGVQANTKRLLEQSKRGMDRDMYYVLDHYFDVVIPQLKRLPRAATVELGEGLNVMALDAYSPELQALVIRSTIEWVHQKETGVITVIPEAWRFLPQGRRSPVRLAAEELVREGAALKNFVWIDSQDIAGVDKLPLRAAKTWLIGVQREPNELRRNLASIPAGFEKPKLHDVATLEVGQFFACFGRSAIKTYVRPAGMDERTAVAIAKGERSVDEWRPASPARAAYAPTVLTRQGSRNLERIADPTDPAGKPAAPPRAALRKEKQPMPETKTEQPIDPQQLLSQFQRFLQGGQRAQAAADAQVARHAPAPASSFNGDEEALYQRFKTRLLAEVPAIAAGGPVTITPPEKLRKDFQRQEADRTVAAARELRPLAKRVLKLVEAIGEGYVSQKAIAERLGRSTGGQSWVDLNKVIKELAGLGFVEMKERQGVRKALRNTIASDLASYGPTDAEIEAVYQSVLFELATEQAE